MSIPEEQDQCGGTCNVSRIEGSPMRLVFLPEDVAAARKERRVEIAKAVKADAPSSTIRNSTARTRKVAAMKCPRVQYNSFGVPCCV